MPYRGHIKNGVVVVARINQKLGLFVLVIVTPLELLPRERSD